MKLNTTSLNKKWFPMSLSVPGRQEAPLCLTFCRTLFSPSPRHCWAGWDIASSETAPGNYIIAKISPGGDHNYL